eukprot:CAMPEP_0118642804 /NCGR_PEP_ID=MMETSP0785-20121206/6031_1 /TAXON_ID=91992 /ORGANISM="Bolidomonas pacifica, Strain CCMP 1866" /LENGTH=218 /DNA_ID=CAMNT_0006534381 /DNA_START=131 /DNA_END=784 /DNA_ORIENTATION=-
MSVAYSVSLKKKKLLIPGTLLLSGSNLNFTPSSSSSSSTSDDSSHCVNLTFSSIENHQYSKETDKKHMMRVLENSKNTVFVLETRGDLEAIKEFVNDALRELGRSTSPKPQGGGNSNKRKKVNKEDGDGGGGASAPTKTTWGGGDEGNQRRKKKKARKNKAKSMIEMQEIASTRASLLANNKELKDSYIELVESGVVDEGTFWDSQAEAITAERGKLR